MDESYFLKDAKQFAKFQGRDIQDKEFVEKFQRHLNNLPASRDLRKKWLELFISATIEEYNNHTKGRKNECESNCQFSLAYFRGIPHAEAELRKIDSMYLNAERLVTFIKNIPSWLLKKWTLIFKLLPVH